MMFERTGLAGDIRKNLILHGLLRLEGGMATLHGYPGIRWPQTEDEFCEVVTVLAYHATDQPCIISGLEGAEREAQDDLERCPVKISEIKETLSRPLGEILSFPGFSGQVF